MYVTIRVDSSCVLYVSDEIAIGNGEKSGEKIDVLAGFILPGK